MNPNALRGMAALAVLCLLAPRVNATPVTLLADKRELTISGPTLGSIHTSPNAPFATFTAGLSAGGMNLWNTSTITPEHFTAEGRLFASVMQYPGTTINVQGVSIFDIAFRVETTTLFNLNVYREAMMALVDVTFSGPNTLVKWDGPTGGFFGNNFFAGGTLHPGDYTINVTQRAGLFSLGGNTPLEARSLYRLNFTTAVPADDSGSPLLLSAISLLAFLVFHRRSVRSFPGV